MTFSSVRRLRKALMPRKRRKSVSLTMPRVLALVIDDDKMANAVAVDQMARAEQIEVAGMATT